MNLRTGFAVLAASLAVVGFACEEDPHDAKTWIDKLGNRADLSESLRNLERLKDPRAIVPLGKAWQKHNKNSQVLRTMITIAGHPDAKTKETHWKDAVPFLIEAVENYDPGDQRSREDAGVAADALGRSRDPDAVPVLLATANKVLPRSSPENHVRIAAVKALGKFKDPKVVDALIKILETDPEKQLLRLNAAAALSLAETGDPRALPALTKALFIGPIYRQVRAGITRVGKPAVPAMMKMYQEKDEIIQEYAKSKDFATKAPGNVVYKGALLLGDLRAVDAVPLLIEGLKSEPRISFFDEKTGAAGPSTHEAILDALRRIAIGDAKAAAAVKDYVKNPKTDDFIRPMAIDVYSMLATDGSMLDDLYKLMADEQQEDQIRAAATLAYGRLARTAAEQKKLDQLIQKYDDKIKAAEEKAKNAKKPEDKSYAEAERDIAQMWKTTLQETGHRLSAGLQCGDKADCYVKIIGGRDVAVGQPGLPKAERALIELAKMGEKARPELDNLLKYVDSRERFVREGVLLALPKIAPLPCDKCAERMIEVIERQQSEQTLDDLNAETRVIYNYFLWAGK